MSRHDDAGGEEGGRRTRAPGWLADALDAEAGQHMPDTRRIRAVMRERTDAAQRKQGWLRRFRLLPRRLAGVPAGIAAGAVCTALVFAITATYSATYSRSHTSSVPDATDSFTTTQPSIGGSAHIVTAAAAIDKSSRAGWSQENVVVTFNQPIAGFQLSVKVSLNSTGSSTGYRTTYDPSLLDVTVDAQAHALVYKFNLKPGKTLPTGSAQFAVQFNYANPHNPADDTYYVSVYTDKAHGRVPDVAQGTF